MQAILKKKYKKNAEFEFCVQNVVGRLKLVL